MQLIAPAPTPRELAAFYTPATIADALARWVVQTGQERLLEPSVGEGALVEAALTEAESRLGPTADLRFLVCDINSAAIEAVAAKLPTGSEARAIDFLQLDVSTTGKFTGAILNPPFTRNHAIERTRRSILRERFGISGAAGLWVHFLLHSLEFLEIGARFAAVVPASALFTSYGRKALERLAGQFAEFHLLRIIDKPVWVNGAQEKGVLVLGAGFRCGSSSLPLPSLWSSAGDPAQGTTTNNAFESLVTKAQPLGTLATMAIGLVTGCNNVFLMSEKELSRLGISKKEVSPIVGRARHVRGLSISADELVDLGVVGERTWLLTPEGLGARGSGIRRQLAKIGPAQRRSTLWFSKRSPWWKVDAGKPCDAVFTYMNDFGPRLVLADSGIRCTNTLHLVRFLATTTHDQQLASSLSLLSTFGQLAAERIGRSYGGGVLKFELLEARSLPILPAAGGSLEESFVLADHALRDGDRDAAREIADRALLRPLLGRGWQSEVDLMNCELRSRQHARRGYKR